MEKFIHERSRYVLGRRAERYHDWSSHVAISSCLGFNLVYHLAAGLWEKAIFFLISEFYLSSVGKNCRQQTLCVAMKMK